MKTRRRLPRKGFDRPQAADPVFTRLCADLMLADATRRRVEWGAMPPAYNDKADRFERGTWQHLANYLSAIARTCPDIENA
jgi:hypothetical protein